MITEEIRAAIDKRISTNDEWAYGVEQCYKEEINILSRNIEDTINFLENECTADEFSWLSEVFDDVAQKTQSRKFVSCLNKIANKFSEECKKYRIDRAIQYAEEALIEE
ncbi:hypothetical protein IJT10_08200 [bacterium]|nr:hypothetical protein [bacterium]